MPEYSPRHQSQPPGSAWALAKPAISEHPAAGFVRGPPGARPSSNMPVKLIDKILFPVDFSDSCLAAARYVEALAGRFEAEIMLLHIVTRGEHTLPEELLPLRRLELDAYLANELKYFTVQRVCTIGEKPATAIVEAAERWDPDLIMMPTHGLGTFTRLLLGSVTAEVLRELQYPVWTTVHSEVPLPLEDIHMRKVLCALDLSERSASVLEWAAALAAEYEACLGIVHATKPMPQPLISVGLENELNRSVTAQARAEIDRLRFTAGLQQTPVFVESGPAAEVIARAQKNFNADLLVIGRHQSGPEEAFPILRDSLCPVVSC